MIDHESRLQVVFADLRRAVDDVILKHKVNLPELLATIEWLEQIAGADELRATSVLFVKTVLAANAGATYAHPEIDGASHWEMEGPAHISDAPELHSPAVLPMRPDEPGEPLIVSGSVRTTTGRPLPGAVLDVWQIDADNVYSGIDASAFKLLDIPNDAAGIPTYNLRGKVITDRDGRFEFRTMMPGIETLGFAPDGPLAGLTKALELPGLRPRHIHAMISADGCLPLTTQIYFDGDPLTDAAIEGPVPASAVKTTTLHPDPADYNAIGLDQPYRSLTYDIVLRPESGPAV
ncbi:catechol 1,2-dioxygenase [Streptomyces sp. NPDC087856]|uniref:dioxygenase family protein n=1 Tax=Streptomyces sp. NPDC087856 TaxID=3365811 RepID=UPI0038122F11